MSHWISADNPTKLISPENKAWLVNLRPKSNYYESSRICRYGVDAFLAKILEVDELH